MAASDKPRFLDLLFGPGFAGWTMGLLGLVLFSSLYQNCQRNYAQEQRMEHERARLREQACATLVIHCESSGRPYLECKGLMECR